ncbi:endonuclease domain-containing protein [Parendozoicomonas haliclonae]|nr:DUF559 domain-containing protein [Parendozoicomonas haliclonae]
MDQGFEGKSLLARFNMTAPKDALSDEAVSNQIREEYLEANRLYENGRFHTAIYGYEKICSHIRKDYKFKSDGITKAEYARCCFRLGEFYRKTYEKSGDDQVELAKKTLDWYKECKKYSDLYGSIDTYIKSIGRDVDDSSEAKVSVVVDKEEERRKRAWVDSQLRRMERRRELSKKIISKASEYTYPELTNEELRRLIEKKDKKAIFYLAENLYDELEFDSAVGLYEKAVKEKCLGGKKKKVYVDCFLKIADCYENIFEEDEADPNEAAKILLHWYRKYQEHDRSNDFVNERVVQLDDQLNKSQNVTKEADVKEDRKRERKVRSAENNRAKGSGRSAKNDSGWNSDFLSRLDENTKFDFVEMLPFRSVVELCESEPEALLLQELIIDLNLNLKSESSVGNKFLTLQCQKRILDFRVDFIINDMVVVEVDGKKYHDNSKSFVNDRKRDQKLMAKGYKVVRLPASQVYQNCAEAIENIINIVIRT